MEKLKCPHCGNEDLFFVKEKYHGTYEYVVNNNGSESEYNYGMYDCTTSKLTSVYYYCCECRKKVKKIPIEKRY